MPPSRDIHLGKAVAPNMFLSDSGLRHFVTEKSPVPTGCIQLDTLLGGGWPKHEISYIQGEPESGKSSLVEEAALSFLETGGDLVCVYALKGDHPLPGFEGRLTCPERFLLLHVETIPEIFASMERFLSAEAGDLDVLVAIDDLSSFSNENSPQEVAHGFKRVIKRLHRNLTLLLVNQVRQAGESIVGAVAYKQAYASMSCGVHVARQHALCSVPGSAHGFTSRGEILKGKNRGKTFTFDVEYGKGVRKNDDFFLPGKV